MSQEKEIKCAEINFFLVKSNANVIHHSISNQQVIDVLFAQSSRNKIFCKD